VIKKIKQESKMLKKIIIPFILIVNTTVLMASDAGALKNACKAGNATACYDYALPLTQDDNAKTQDILEEGMAYMRRACLSGEEKGCDVMGDRYFIDKNFGAARPYLIKSCNRGIKSACEATGTIYRDGHDVKQNDVKAREFFEKACALKSGDSCYNVAIIYRGGFGVEKSRTKEKEFYKKGCDVGLKAGCMRFTELDNEDKGIKTGLWIDIKNWFK
jgi:TPR repeat protein